MMRLSRLFLYEATPDPTCYVAPATRQVLVRLKVEYTGFFTLNNQRFGQRYDQSTHSMTSTNDCR